MILIDILWFMFLLPEITHNIVAFTPLGCIFNKYICFTNFEQYNQMNKNIGKSAFAILAGMITIIIPSIATDFILEQSGIFPGFIEQQELGV